MTGRTAPAPAPARTWPLPRGLRRSAYARAVLAEWGKAASVRAPWLCLAAALLTAVGSAAGLANDHMVDVRSGAQPPFAVADPVAILGQALQLAVVVAAAGLMVLVTSEYATGEATATFTVQPRRATVLAAKATVAALLGFAVGALTAAVTTGVVSAVLGRHAAPDGPGPATVAVRAGLLWAALALFVVGLATLLRSAVGTLAALIVVLLGLLVVPDPVGPFLPGQAAQVFLTGSPAPYPSALGLVLVAAWSVALLLVARVVQDRRDV